MICCNGFVSNDEPYGKVLRERFNNDLGKSTDDDNVIKIIAFLLG